MPSKLRLGLGAQCSMLVKYMRSGKVIDDKMSNTVSWTRIRNLIVVREDKKFINKKEQAMIVFSHGDFDGTEIYCV